MKKLIKIILFAILSGAVLFAGLKLVNFAIERLEETDTEEVSEEEDHSGALPFMAVSYDDVSPIVDAVMPSVVSIDCEIPVEEYNIFGGSKQYIAKSSGSGFIVSQSPSQLFVCTNEHVIKDAQKVSVSFFDGKSVEAFIVGSDSSYDLAIVSVPTSKIGKETLSKIRISSIGNSDNIMVGDKDIAIGNSLGYGMAVTVGHVSAIGREITIDGTRSGPLLQTDAAINPGNSGGPLLDIYGQVIGINCAKYSGVDIEGIGYAIPINNVVSTINELINSFSIDEGEAGCLGIVGKDVSEGYAKGFSMPRGVYVYSILDRTHAADSDLKVGDIITHVNGQEVLTYDYLKERVGHYKAGTTVTLTVKRPSRTKYIEIEIDVVLDTLE